jgi:hypothetical protein
MPSQRGRDNDIALTTFSSSDRGSIHDTMAHGSGGVESGWDRGDAEESQALLGGDERDDRFAPSEQASHVGFFADPPEPKVSARKDCVNF